MTGDLPESFHETLAEELHIVERHLGNFYNLPQIAGAYSEVIVGETDDDQLERLLDRAYSVQKSPDGYSLNDEDFDDFELDVAYMMSPEHDAATLARRLFIGMGVAGTAVRELWAQHDTAVFKRARHQDLVKEFFADKDDINATVREIFSEPGLSDRQHMTEGLTDKRSISINGMRLRLRVLFDVAGMDDFLGVEQFDLIEAARDSIKRRYERDAEFYDDTLFVGLGQPPHQGDKLFFDALSDFVVAAATPLRPEKARHLFSPAWSID